MERICQRCKEEEATVCVGCMNDVGDYCGTGRALKEVRFIRSVVDKVIAEVEAGKKDVSIIYRIQGAVERKEELLLDEAKQFEVEQK